MFGGRDDVPAEVELIDLSEGDDVDPVNVAAANLKANAPVWLYSSNLELLKEIPTL